MVQNASGFGTYETELVVTAALEIVQTWECLPLILAAILLFPTEV